MQVFLSYTGFRSVPKSVALIDADAGTGALYLFGSWSCDWQCL